MLLMKRVFSRPLAAVPGTMLEQMSSTISSGCPAPLKAKSSSIPQIRIGLPGSSLSQTVWQQANAISGKFLARGVVKAFNTYIASFEAAAKDNSGQIAMFISGADAKQIVGGLVQTVGFEPADLGGWKNRFADGCSRAKRRSLWRSLHTLRCAENGQLGCSGHCRSYALGNKKLTSNVRLEVGSSAHTDGCDGLRLRNCYIPGGLVNGRKRAANCLFQHPSNADKFNRRCQI
jgi:hypothetical protein